MLMFEFSCFFTRVHYLEQTGQTGSALYKVAIMAQEMGSFYSYSQHGGVSVEAIRVS